MLTKTVNFLKTDIWRIRLRNYPPSKSFLLRQLRIVLLAVRGFVDDKCKFRASALTFFSLLSVVPVIAVMFGIAKGFGLEKRVQAELLLKMQGQKEVAESIINFANSLLENTSGGFIAGIGVALLFWSVIQVLSNIEHSFNDIWGVKTPRSITRKFSDYLSMVLVCPFLLIIAGSANVVISTRIQAIIRDSPLFGALGPFLLLLLKLLPYCTIWSLFTFIYIFLPNTKVKLKSAFLSGIVAGTIFQVVQWVYINFQIGAAKYSAVYGSFAALPLFLLWLQTSWLVVLFGAELSFAHQNVETYEFEQDCLSVSNSFKKRVSLLITHRLVKNFCNGEQRWDAAEISRVLEIPIRLVRQVLFELVGAGILSQVSSDGKDVAYQPAVDVGKINVKYVIEALDQRGNSDIPIGSAAELARFSECLRTFACDVEKSPANIPLKDL